MAEIPLKSNTQGSTDHLTAQDLKSFGPDQTKAIRISDFIYQAKGVANTLMIITSEGNVIFDTGLSPQAPQHKELLQAVDSGPIRYIIISHAHADHVGGVHLWREKDTTIIADRQFPTVQRYLRDLQTCMWHRNRFFYEEVMPPEPPDLLFQEAVEPNVLVDDVYRFELGGIRFEVLHTPGAEGADNICLWLPDHKILFSGDFFGPLFPMWPNLYTFRGEPYRFAVPYIDSLNRVLALEPEMIVPSHFDAITGREGIKAGITRIRDAVEYVHDATVKGMNEGKDVYTLMREIKLPPELYVSEGHGKVSWCVRSIWEGYLGWFYFDSTAALYDVPVSAVYPDIVRMAGGADAFATRARERLASGEPIEALHLVDVALAAEPKNRAALEVKLQAHQAILDRCDKVNFHEVTWLERMIRLTEEALGN